MLRELHISGLGIIDDLDLQLTPGLTVLTGETGAGKTMLTVGLSLAAGARASAQLVGVESDDPSRHASAGRGVVHVRRARLEITANGIATSSGALALGFTEASTRPISFANETTHRRSAISAPGARRRQ